MTRCFFLLPVSGYMTEIFRSQVCGPYLAISFLCTAGSSGREASVGKTGKCHLPGARYTGLLSIYYLFCNIVSKLWDKVTSQKFLCGAWTADLNPRAAPEKLGHLLTTMVSSDARAGRTCGVWTQPGPARERQKRPQPLVSCSLPSKGGVHTLVHAGGRRKFQFCPCETTWTQ